MRKIIKGLYEINYLNAGRLPVFFYPAQGNQVSTKMYDKMAEVVSGTDIPAMRKQAVL